jgi:hypothetical protein
MRNNGGSVDMAEENQSKAQRVELGLNTGEVEGGFDVSEHIGKKSKVAKVEEFLGEYGYYIKVVSEPVATIEAGNGEKIEVRASKIFSLATDKDDEKRVGWTKKSKLAAYLAKMKVTHYRELVGKAVIIQSQTAKNGNEYLTF